MVVRAAEVTSTYHTRGIMKALGFHCTEYVEVPSASSINHPTTLKSVNAAEMKNPTIRQLHSSAGTMFVHKVARFVGSVFIEDAI